jgi:hypothetical protein
MRQYAIDHPNIRLKEALPTDSTRVDANHEGPFGIKTKLWVIVSSVVDVGIYWVLTYWLLYSVCSAEESMGSILQAQYTDFTNEDTDYPSVTSIKKTGFMPVPKATIASQSVLLARQKADEGVHKSHFIMKKFQNVKSTQQRERDAKEQENHHYDE